MSIFDSSGTGQDEGELVTTGINIVGNLFFVFQKDQYCIQMCVFIHREALGQHFIYLRNHGCCMQR